MSHRVFFGLFHAVLLLLFVLTGWRHFGYDVITVDELHTLVTARNLLTDGSLYLSEENAALYYASYPYWPLPVSRSTGRAYSFRGALPALPVALLLKVARPLTACHNVAAYLIMLWVMHRLRLHWRAPPARYYWAVLLLTFGCAAAAHWFTYFPSVLTGALLLLLIYAYDRYGLTGRRTFLLLAAAALTAVLIARQEIIIVVCVPLATLTWQWRGQGRGSAAAVALALALATGGGANLLFNFFNTGLWGNNGHGTLRWTTDGLWRWLVEPNENPLLLNPWLLLLCNRYTWRHARHYLLAALAAWVLYSCWWGWDSGYLRQLVPALLLAAPALLTVRIHRVALVLTLIALLCNAAYYFVPYFDVYGIWQIGSGGTEELYEPVLGWRLLWLQAQGLLTEQ